MRKTNSPELEKLLLASTLYFRARKRQYWLEWFAVVLAIGFMVYVAVR
jgi:hypothetical protein